MSLFAKLFLYFKELVEGCNTERQKLTRSPRITNLRHYHCSIWLCSVSQCHFHSISLALSLFLCLPNTKSMLNTNDISTGNYQGMLLVVFHLIHTGSHRIHISRKKMQFVVKMERIKRKENRKWFLSNFMKMQKSTSLVIKKKKIKIKMKRKLKKGTNAAFKISCNWTPVNHVLGSTF